MGYSTCESISIMLKYIRRNLKRKKIFYKKIFFVFCVSCPPECRERRLIFLPFCLLSFLSKISIFNFFPFSCLFIKNAYILKFFKIHFVLL
ncbi:unnamed protein product [Meloidogyne enterolobii]|uniref:Uncharacterized protein n=1 Tax=Meloidogyne enterolobii TaxID=390850 RepID=A0ACB1AQM9_MELEN